MVNVSVYIVFMMNLFMETVDKKVRQEYNYNRFCQKEGMYHDR